MKKWVGWVLLVLSLYVTYEGWRNSQPEAFTEVQARAIACEGREGCTVESAKPVKLRTDFLGREYEWKTSAGPVAVECRRDYLFQGAWRCTAREGAL